MYDSAAYVQAGTPVGDGVRFQWRHSHPAVEPDQDMDGGEDDAANDNGTDSWQEDLSHLSGGAAFAGSTGPAAVGAPFHPACSRHFVPKCHQHSWSVKWLRIYPRIFDTMREDAAEFAVQRLAGYRHKYMLIGVPAVCLKHNPCCVQAAQMGGRARLLLLDEVDAALDESNQRRAAPAAPTALRRRPRMPGERHSSMHLLWKQAYLPAGTNWSVSLYHF